MQQERIIDFIKKKWFHVICFSYAPGMLVYSLLDPFTYGHSPERAGVAAGLIGLGYVWNKYRAENK